MDARHIGRVTAAGAQGYAKDAAAFVRQLNLVGNHIAHPAAGFGDGLRAIQIGLARQQFGTAPFEFTAKAANFVDAAAIGTRDMDDHHR